MGLPSPHRPRRNAVLTDGLTSPRGKRQFRRGVFDDGNVTTYGPPASHHLRWLASANCLLEIGEDVTEMTAGSQVRRLGLKIRPMARRRSTVPADDPPPVRSLPTASSWSARPFHRCTPPESRSCQRDWRWPRSAGRIAGCGPRACLPRAPTRRSSAIPRACHQTVPASSSRRPTDKSRSSIPRCRPRSSGLPRPSRCRGSAFSCRCSTCTCSGFRSAVRWSRCSTGPGTFLSADKPRCERRQRAQQHVDSHAGRT